MWSRVRDSGGVSRQALPPSPGTAVFDRLRAIDITRPPRTAGPGVCRAVAGRVGVDPLIVRIGIVVSAALFGLGVLLYGICWLLLPEPDGRIHAEQLLRGEPSAGAIGAIGTCLLSLSAFGGVQLSGDGGLSLTAFAVAGLFFGGLWLTRDRRVRRNGAPAGGRRTAPQTGRSMPPTEQLISQPGQVARLPIEPARPAQFGSTQFGPAQIGSTQIDPAQIGPGLPPAGVPVVDEPASVTRPQQASTPARRAAGPRIVAATLGAVLVIVAVSVGLHLRGVTVPGGLPTWGVIAALAVIGVVTIAVGLAGRRSGGLATLAVVTLAAGLLTAGTAPGTSLWHSYLTEAADSADPTWRLSGQLTSDASFEAGLRSRTLDLTEVSTNQETPRTISVDASLGHLTVRVPRGLTIQADVEHEFGVFEVDGVSVTDQSTQSLGPAGRPDLYLTGTADLGVLVVETA